MTINFKAATMIGKTLTLWVIGMLFFAMKAISAPVPAVQREVLICVSNGAPASIQQAALDLSQNYASVPVLKALIDTQGAGPVKLVSSEDVMKNYNLAAYNHLVVVGLKSEDPLVSQVWEHYAIVDEAQKTITMLGWGNLEGDVGYIEGDRNPFLHSKRIQSAPFETVLFKVSGTDTSGVLAGVKAFEGGMLNGLVPVGAVTRPTTTILDLDPLTSPAPFSLPTTVPVTDHTGNAVQAPLVGVTQVPGNEYRAYIDVAGFEPVHAWRYKYLEPHALDRAGVAGWMAGFQRMAYGNAVNIVQFASADQASQTAATIGKDSGWHHSVAVPGLAAWETVQPTDEVMPVSLGKIYVFAHGNFLIMSSLPAAATAAVAASLN